MDKKPQQNKKKRKATGDKYSPSSIYLKVIGTGAPGAPSSVYVFAGQTSYLFNCGEGTQRLCTEHGTKFLTTEHVFTTHKCWGKMGGLPGFLLSQQETGLDLVNLYGPMGVGTLITNLEGMVHFNTMSIVCHNSSVNNGMVGAPDDPISIKCVPIVPVSNVNNQKTQENDVNDQKTSPNNQLDFEEKNGNEKRSSDSDSPDEKSPKRCRSENESLDEAMAYICKVTPKPGKLLLTKCVQAKVPPGPLLGDLKAGKDVTLPSGDVVKAVDVTEPDDPGPLFLVVDAPTLYHLPSLVDSPPLVACIDNHTPEAVVQVAVHFSPPAVVASDVYQAWLARFCPSTHHIFINQDNRCLGSSAIHENQRRLHIIDPVVFPTLHDTSILDAPEESTTNSPEKLEAVNGHQEVFSNLMYHLRPRTDFDESSRVGIDMKKFREDVHLSGLTAAVAGEGKEEFPVAGEGKEEFPVVTFLGTGSSQPNKNRNVSSILVQTSADNFILLDCGEGSYNQLVRLYGLARTDAILCCLSGVYVSHMHADHHLGLISFITKRASALEKRGTEFTPLVLLSVPLVSPESTISYLKLYHHHCQPIEHLYVYRHNANFMTMEMKQICAQLQLAEVRTCKVFHCKDSFGVAITLPSGYKLVYSGDTVPSEQLEELGRDCDLLIHESTMEDGLEVDASIKRHCTVSQALGVARNMGAKSVVLTHFSQRYSRLAFLPHTIRKIEEQVNRNQEMLTEDIRAKVEYSATENGMAEDPAEECQNDVYDRRKVALAYDNMRIVPSDVPRMAAKYQQLIKMFSENYDEICNKIYKRLTQPENHNRKIQERVTKLNSYKKNRY